MNHAPKIERAILSVSNKEGLAEFGRDLVTLGVELYSTGGTRRHLEEANVPVRDISAYTEFPEMMEGRLKTLHPKVHGGILCRHDREDDMNSLAEHGILPFPLVVVNLYPFEATVAKPDVTDDEAIENIDIGGPTMIRAAAKNHDFTTVVTDPRQYAEVVEQIRDGGGTTLSSRRRLAGAAFAMTARYDRAITEYFARDSQDNEDATSPLPDTISLALERTAELRYGENPHQQAALYRSTAARGMSLVDARKRNGKELSYNNLLDLDSALALVRMLPEAGTVVLKHNNPCGAATAATLMDATRHALAGDPVSAFGSVLGFNQEVDAATAELLATPGYFVEAIVAPGFSDAAMEILTTRPKWKSNVRLIEVDFSSRDPDEVLLRPIAGGMLAQTSDSAPDDYDAWKIATETKPDAAMMADLRFTWTLVRHVKSNAIVLGKDQTLWGVGAGQMSRVDSVDIAIRKAADHGPGCVMASDAFFPFPDSIEAAAEAGIRAIVQPGGSRRDDEVIAACNAHKLPMILTGRRHFRH